MLYENWLHSSSQNIKTPYCPSLQKDITVECLVIGGGFAGLHAALKLVDAGKKVVLLEKGICGSGSSGKSGGFLTPDSEKDMNQLIQSYGKKRAKALYQIPSRGVDLILKTIKRYNFDCDLRKQDSLYLSFKKSHDQWLKEEAKIKKNDGLSCELFKAGILKRIHPAKGYTLGLKYPGSYGINSFAYCQEMRSILLRKGVKIFESSEVHRMEGNTVKTHLGSVKAKNILICIDKMKTEFNEEISKKLYHAQSYLAVSEPLSKQEMKFLFPREELMCWDSRMIYTHYRPVAGNRILIGGGGLWATYSPNYTYSPKIIERLINELKERFPKLKDIHFPYYWAGLIDVTQDLEPLVDYDKNNKSIQYALGCAGLPWAAYCGDYIARRMLNPEQVEDLSEFARVDRNFFLSGRVQKLLGKRITFALSHFREELRK